jgi:serine O-acetyltransferase
MHTAPTDALESNPSSATAESIGSDGAFWSAVQREAQKLVAEEPILGSFYHATILNHDSFGAALSFHLANRLDNAALPAMLVREVIAEALEGEPEILHAAAVDAIATRTRDPACEHLCTPMLHFKGYQALQAHRVAHRLWHGGRRALALHLQSQVSATLGVDIHPAARIGLGIMLDHATGIVIGETAVVEDDVSILHSVTLGGTGKEGGDRHPKIRRGVLLAAGCKIIGNIEIGEGAKVGAGSVVLQDVPSHVTVAGVPATIVGRPSCDSPALDMNHALES